MSAELSSLLPWIVAGGAIGVAALVLWFERRHARLVSDRSRDLERLSLELIRANRTKSEFLASISHELRTPLNAIVGFTDLLADKVYGDLNARQAQSVARIEASANHLRHLVDQILDLAKMAAGRMEVHPEPLEIRPFVIDVVNEIEPLAVGKELSLVTALDPELPRLSTDCTHLRQILVNLVGNAVKYTDQGSVSVCVHRRSKPAADASAAGRDAEAGKAEWIAIEVTDTGAGIAPSDQQRIFDEFEQVNAGSRGDSMLRGTGLGLPISMRLARLLGGDITLNSDIGAGSTFTLWVPISGPGVGGSTKLESRAEPVSAAEYPLYARQQTGPLGW